MLRTIMRIPFIRFHSLFYNVNRIMGEAQKGSYQSVTEKEPDDHNE